jgi:hypothetical protein
MQVLVASWEYAILKLIADKGYKKIRVTQKGGYSCQMHVNLEISLFSEMREQPPVE